MRISERLRSKANKLLFESKALIQPTSFETVWSRREAWITSCDQLFQLLVPDEQSPYRQAFMRAWTRPSYGRVDETVDGIAAILRQLVEDIDDGLLSPIEAQAQVVVFEDFLEHAVYYLRGGRPAPAGVIAGVVFEDTIRQACERNNIPQRDVKLDLLISSLSKKDVLSDPVAARARAAATVRTKATHAQWNEFNADDVQAALDLTRQLIRDLLGG